MKKVIFICLLSLSMCLSLPQQQTGAQTPPQAAAPSSAETKVQPLEDKSKTTTVASVHTEAAQAAQTATNTITPAKAINQETKEAAKQGEDNKTDKKANEEAAKTTNDAPGKPEVHTEDNIKPSEASTVAPTTKTEAPTENKNAVPEKNETKTTEAPKSVTEHPAVPIVQSRAFDGPSFIGGIVLTLGLLAIGFMGLRYYKNQTERNYHTL